MTHIICHVITQNIFLFQCILFEHLKRMRILLPILLLVLSTPSPCSLNNLLDFCYCFCPYKITSMEWRGLILHGRARWMHSSLTSVQKRDSTDLFFLAYLQLNASVLQRTMRQSLPTPPMTPHSLRQFMHSCAFLSRSTLLLCIFRGSLPGILLCYILHVINDNGATLRLRNWLQSGLYCRRIYQTR